MLGVRVVTVGAAGFPITLRYIGSANMGGTYRDLIAWQKAIESTVGIYKSTQEFPSDEKFALTSQLRRAAVSVASNIAEGKGRGTDRELVHYLYCARGSAYEVQTQLEIARSLGYLADEAAVELDSKAAEVGRLLNGLIGVFDPIGRAKLNSRSCSLKSDVTGA
jgi:four helix bundle protein